MHLPRAVLVTFLSCSSFASLVMIVDFGLVFFLGYSTTLLWMGAIGKLIGKLIGLSGTFRTAAASYSLQPLSRAGLSCL